MESWSKDRVRIVRRYETGTRRTPPCHCPSSTRKHIYTRTEIIDLFAVLFVIKVGT